MTSFSESTKMCVFILNEFSQIANIEAELTKYWHERGAQLRKEKCIYDNS